MRTLPANNDRPRRSNVTIPNVLSSLRIASVPVLLWLAWTGRGRAYVIAFGAIYATDFLDGLLARWLKQKTELTSLACLEEIAITLILPVARSNVPNLWHAWRFRRRHQAEVRGSEMNPRASA